MMTYDFGAIRSAVVKMLRVNMEPLTKSRFKKQRSKKFEF